MCGSFCAREYLIQVFSPPLAVTYVVIEIVIVLGWAARAKDRPTHVMYLRDLIHTCKLNRSLRPNITCVYKILK